MLQRNIAAFKPLSHLDAYLSAGVTTLTDFEHVVHTLGHVVNRLAGYVLAREPSWSVVSCTK
jgi:hypothetical protein